MSYPLFYTLLESAGKTSATALDFGCGNGAFIRYLRGKGIETLGVDPVHVDNDMSPYVYSSLDDLSEKRFDVITAFEVFEHLDRPDDTISQLLSHLEENGFVYITTALTNRALTSIRCFQHWIYQKDPTHIGFFHERTFEWLAARHGLEIHVFRYDSVVLDRSFERLVDIEKDGFVFREVRDSHILHKPGPF
jgi:SAM-dependent methyltransferase